MLPFFNETETSSNLTAVEPELAKVKEHYRKRTRLTTDKLPKDLPVEVIGHILPEEKRICPDCGGMLLTMGKETREELKIIPAKAVITRHVQYVYSCRNCESTSDHVPIVKADMPEPVIKGSFASPDTIARIAVQKFMMAPPCTTRRRSGSKKAFIFQGKPCPIGLSRLPKNTLSRYMQR